MERTGGHYVGEDKVPGSCFSIATMSANLLQESISSHVLRDFRNATEEAETTEHDNKVHTLARV